MKPLTPREAEVLQMSCEGHQTKVIAHMLGIKERSVEQQKRNVRKKLNGYGKSNEWIGAQALKLGLIRCKQSNKHHHHAKNVAAK